MCILLVVFTQVYDNARFKKCQKYSIYVLFVTGISFHSPIFVSCSWPQEDGLSYTVLTQWMILHNVQYIILHVPNVLTGYVYLICDADAIDWMPWFLSWSGSRATELPRMSCWQFWMTVTTDTSLLCSMRTLRWGGSQWYAIDNKN
jgi:hypothetical protein